MRRARSFGSAARALLSTLPCAAALAIAAPSLPAGAQATYKWIDSEGTVHVTDRPPPVMPDGRAPPPPSAADQATPLAPVSAPPPPPVHVEPSLRRLELPYVGLEGRARRVIVQVRFNDRVTASLALDTGAPGMILSLELAERLDLLSRDQGRLLVLTSGIGGSTPAIRAILESVSIGGAVERFVPVTITSSVSDAFEGLVGMDFMGNYQLTIDPARKMVVLQEQTATAQAPGGHDENWWRGLFAEFRGQRDDWRRYKEALDRIAEESLSRGGILEQKQELAKFQLREAELLYSRLERYASAQSVPRQWR